MIRLAPFDFETVYLIGFSSKFICVIIKVAISPEKAF